MTDRNLPDTALAELSPVAGNDGSDSGGPTYIHDDDDDAMAPAPVPGFASLKASEHAVEASAVRFGPAAMVVDPEAPAPGNDAEAAPHVGSPWRWSFGIGANEQEDGRKVAFNQVGRLTEDVESLDLNRKRVLPVFYFLYANIAPSYGTYGTYTPPYYTPPYYTPPYYTPPYRFSVFVLYWC
jgi:hypothetical protein